jgi:hypothetical protein
MATDQRLILMCSDAPTSGVAGLQNRARTRSALVSQAARAAFPPTLIALG